MIKKILVILFAGIFTSIVITSELEQSINDITRNSPPELVDIPNQTILEDETLVYQLQASDPDNDLILYLPPNITGPASGNIDDDGVLTVIPNLNYNGIINITITISDEQETDSDSFDLDVVAVNDDPILDFINSVSFPEDNSTIITVSATDVDSENLFYSCSPTSDDIICNVNNNEITFSATPDYNGIGSALITVSDVQGGEDSQSVQITVNPTNDNPILNNIENISFLEDESTAINVSATDIDGDNLSFSCNPGDNIICNINGNQITFSSNQDYNGTEAVEIIVQDGNGGDDLQTINITVSPVNDAPVLDFIPNISFQEDESEILILNASDVENDFLTYGCTPLGNEVGCLINGNQLTVTSPPNYNGIETIRITVIDATLADSQDVNVTVSSVNDPVESLGEISDISVDEDSDDVIIDLSNHFYDVEDGVNLSYQLINLGDLGTVISSSIAGTILTIDFIDNKHGSGSPVLRACDSNSDCFEDEFNITVNSINDQPNLSNIPAPPSSIVINREYSFLVDPSNADVDDTQFNFTITSSPGGGDSSLEATENNEYGNFLWYPNTLGQFNITIKLIDFNSENGSNGVQEDTYSWSVEVVDANNNNPPEIADIDDDSIDEDGVFILILDITDLDNNLADLNVNVYDEYTQHISYGTTLQTNFENGQWVLTVTPEADWNGDINVIVSASDGSNSANKEFLLTVNPVNDTPNFEFIDECEIQFDEDTSYTYNLYISDIDSHEYYNVTPQETINYVLTPVGNEIAGELLESQIVFQNETNFYDEVNDLNTMTFTPIQDFKGTQVFNLTLTDGSGSDNDTYSQEFIVCVNNVNDPPILSFIDDIAFDEDTQSDILVVYAEDDVVDPLYSDSDNAQFTYDCTPYDNNVGCEVTGSNIIFFNLVEHFFGTQNFMIIANDGDGGQDSQDITVTVNPVNDQPIANEINTSTNEDQASTFSLSADDVENYALTYFIVDNPFSPENGTVLNNDDGTVTYTPDDDFNGTDTFSFWVVDEDIDSFNNLESENAVVTITINPVNDPPVLDENNITSFVFDEDEEDDVSRTFSIDVSDIDINDVFNFTCNPLGSNLTCLVEVVDSTPDDGGKADITIVSPQDYNGTESVEITVFDGAGGQDIQTIDIIVNPINDAPTVSDSNESFPEDMVLDITFDGIDVDGDDLTYNIITQTSHGLVINNNDGTANYTPNAEFNGEDSFTYIANDGFLDSEEPPATVFITVNPINDPPVLDVIGSFDFNEDEPYTLSATANDVDGDVLTYICNPITANIICSVDGSDITFTTPEHYNGIESVDIIVSDGNGGNDSEEVEITINPINDAPIVIDSIESTNEDTAIIISFNGSDVDGDDLTYTILSQPENGLIINNNDSTATYTPNSEFNGEDSFTYKANDGSLDSEEPSATLTIIVNPVDDPPILDNIDNNNFDEDESLVFNVSATDLEDDDEFLVYECNTGENLECVVNGNEITLTAPLNYNGIESVEIEVFDSFNNSDSQSIEITVNPINDAPELSNMELETQEETGKTINLAGTDLDGDNPLFYSILTNVDNGLLLFGVDTLNVFPTGLIEGGIIVYQPNDDFVGIDDFTYRVNDGILDSDNDGTVTIEVTATNDEPVSDNVSITVLEGQSTTDSFSISDPDGDPLTINILEGPFEEGASVIDNGDGTFTYFAPDNDTGDPGDSFTYNCMDPSGAISNTSTVLITILPSNDDPVLDNILTIITDEDAPITIIANATDEEEHVLTFHCVSGENILCSVDENDTSLITFTSAEDHWNGNETLTIYVTDENGGGLDQYGLPVDVSSQEVVVIIEAVNDIIETEEVEGIINEDETFEINLFDYMINVDNLGDYTEAVDYNIFISGEDGNCVVDNDGIMTYTPDLDFPYTNINSGKDTCSFFISEITGPNISDTSFINIEILPINDNPILDFIADTSFIEDKSYLIELFASDVDAGDNLTFSCEPSDNISCQIKNNILTGTNIVENFFGIETITVYVEDEYGGIDSQEVNIEVTFQNDPPQLNQVDDIIFNEDESIKVLIQAFDPDPNTTLQFSCDNSESIICEVVEGDDLGDGNYLSYVHFSAVQDFNGSDIVLITVDDQFGRAQDSQNVNVIVNAVNDAPVTSFIDLQTKEDQPIDANLSEYTIDVDDDLLQYTIVENAINGVCIIDNGSISYTPDEHYPYDNKVSGFDTCRYQASDGKLISESLFSIEIISENDNPVAGNINLKTREDMSVGVLLSDYSQDFDNDELSYRIELTGNNGNCLHKGNGIIEYTPNENYPTGHKTGQDTCSYYVDDYPYGTSSNEGYIYIIIEPENDPPILNSIKPIVFEEDSFIENGFYYSLDILATDSENDELTFSCQQIQNNSEDNINIFCDFNIVPSEDFLSAEISFSNIEHFNGTEFVRFIVDDGYEGLDSLDVQVTVLPTPDAPVFIDLPTLSIYEETPTIRSINAFDPDIGDLLTFSCEGLEGEDVFCGDENIVLKSDGTFEASFTLIPNANFYGFADVEFTISDGYNERLIDKDTLSVEVFNVDDPPSISASILQINENEESISNNMVSFDELEGADAIQFIFNISDSDSLANADKLFVTSQPLGFYSDDLMDIDSDFNSIDLKSVCYFSECVIDSLDVDTDFENCDKHELKEDCVWDSFCQWDNGMCLSNADDAYSVDDANVICPLNCNHNFSGHFVQQFIITDSDNLMDTIDVNINIKQVNDAPYSNLQLEHNLSNYSKSIDIKDLKGPVIDENIYFDKTKFFGEDVLTNTNPLPADPNLDSLYVYMSAIDNLIPSYYFIWGREQAASYFDPDTDAALNQKPYNLYYRLELINNEDVYVIADYIDDSIFTGQYAYVLAEIKTDSLYPKYNVNNLYVPELHSENTSLLKNVNGDVYNWRIVSQNYSSVDNDKIESECKLENEFWDNEDGMCIEFEHPGVISYNNSEQFLLDLEYTKGEFKFILNPLDLYLDHYDMYFIPNDQVIIGESDYSSYSYINYTSEILESGSTELVDLNYFSSNNIFQSIGRFKNLDSMDMFVFTVDDHNNTYINVSYLNYDSIIANQQNSAITSQSGNMFVKFSNNSFGENSRVLIYESSFINNDIIRNYDVIDSSLVDIVSNKDLIDGAWIYFSYNQIPSEYNINYVKINQIIDNQLIEYPTYNDGNNIFTEINEFGTFILSYNENSIENESIIPYEFGITSCYPNPFNPIVSIDYTIDIDSNVKLSVYNILGQKINMIDYGYQPQGSYTASWDGTNREGITMPSGTYFLEISNYSSKMVKAVTLLK